MTTLIVLWLIMGGVAAAIGAAKQRSVGSSFLWGALLGVLGVIVVLCLPGGLPKAPPNMHALKCPRCNAIQNVPAGQRVYECWQCHGPQERWASPELPALPAMVATRRMRCHLCKHVQDVPATQSGFVCDGCGKRVRLAVDEPRG